MKKNVLASLMAAASIFAINNAFAEDGTINFTGEIIDNACQLSSGSDAQQVNLGKVSKTALPSAGSTTAATSFTIKLSDCPAAVTNAHVKFDAISYIGDSTVMALKQEADVAEGVGIQILDNTSTVIPLFTDSKAYPLVQNTENSLEFRARYIAKSDTIKAGPANGIATFTVSYN